MAAGGRLSNVLLSKVVEFSSHATIQIVASSARVNCKDPLVRGLEVDAQQHSNDSTNIRFHSTSQRSIILSYDNFKAGAEHENIHILHY